MQPFHRTRRVSISPVETGVGTLPLYSGAVAGWEKGTERIGRRRAWKEVHRYGGRLDWLAKAVRDIPPLTRSWLPISHHRVIDQDTPHHTRTDEGSEI